MYEELIKTLRLRAALWEKMYDEDNTLKQAADAIEELQKLTDAQLDIIKQYQAYLTKQRWIPVAERLPNDFQNVLIVFQNSDMAVGFKMTVKTEETILLLWRTMTEEDFCTDCDTPPTHWMPLPTPPKEET